MRPIAMQSAERGASLLELIIALVLVSVLALGAFPSFRALTERNRLTSAANEIVSVFQLARAEAIRRNRRVEICPSVDGLTCAGSDWTGIVIRVPSNDDVIRFVQIQQDGLQVSASPNVADNDRIAFGPDGLARVGSGNSPEGSLSVCTDRLSGEPFLRDIAVAASRVSVTERVDSSCSAPAN